MVIKVDFRNFWRGFEEKFDGGIKRSLIKLLEEEGIQFQLDKENPDIIFFNAFGEITYQGPALKIGYVTEPMTWFKAIMDKIKVNYMDMVVGCVPNIKSKFIKLPLYLSVTDPKNMTKERIDGINQYVKNKVIEFDPKSKSGYNLKFCALINRHDNFNTRTPILRKLEKIGFVDCPGILHNNVKSFDDDGISKVDYLKGFLFNICPENTPGHEGYITEKIINCSESGCIPVYHSYGLDEMDKRFFNVNRIILYDPNNEESLEKAYLKVKSLLEDKNELIKFYKQDVFHPDAHLVVDESIANYKKKFKKFFKKNNLL